MLALSRVVRGSVCVNRKVIYTNTYATIRNLAIGSNNAVDTKWSRRQNVADYYAGKRVFVIGGTGFVGKILIERLLMNCPEIDRIYVLVREKQGTPKEDRLEQMLNVPIFDKLRQIKPDALKKIFPVEGDMVRSSLAMRPEDEQEVINYVSVVFHIAALVKFTTPLKSMLEINVEGTRRIMNLCKNIKNLEVFLYVSTVFANTSALAVDEVIYPPPKNLHEVYRLIEKHGDDSKEIHKLYFGANNSYTLSKLYCENLVDQERANMPAIIVRPSLVTPVLNEPLIGWIDSWSGATALYSDIARGLTKVIYGKKDVICDIIPVDYVSNLAIVAAARGNRSDEVIVYSCSSGSSNPITWDMGLSLYLDESLKHCKIPGVLKPKISAAESWLTVKFLTFIRQTVPSFLADLWLLVKGQKPIHMKMQQRAVLARDLNCNLTATSWVFKSDNSQRLVASMNEDERKLFTCDPKTIVWKDYMGTFYNGVQKYLLKINNEKS